MGAFGQKGVGGRSFPYENSELGKEAAYDNCALRGWNSLQKGRCTLRSGAEVLWGQKREREQEL